MFIIAAKIEKINQPFKNFSIRLMIIFKIRVNIPGHFLTFRGRSFLNTEGIKKI